MLRRKDQRVGDRSLATEEAPPGAGSEDQGAAEEQLVQVASEALPAKHPTPMASAAQALAQLPERCVQIEEVALRGEELHPRPQRRRVPGGRRSHRDASAIGSASRADGDRVAN